jgi:hypothetical protein
MRPLIPTESGHRFRPMGTRRRPFGSVTICLHRATALLVLAMFASAWLRSLAEARESVYAATERIENVPDARPRAIDYKKDKVPHPESCKFDVVFGRSTIIDGRYC